MKHILSLALPISFALAVEAVAEDKYAWLREAPIKKPRSIASQISSKDPIAMTATVAISSKNPRRRVMTISNVRTQQAPPRKRSVLPKTVDIEPPVLIADASIPLKKEEPVVDQPILVAETVAPTLPKQAEPVVVEPIAVALEPAVEAPAIETLPIEVAVEEVEEELGGKRKGRAGIRKLLAGASKATLQTELSRSGVHMSASRAEAYLAQLQKTLALPVQD